MILSSSSIHLADGAASILLDEANALTAAAHRLCTNPLARDGYEQAIEIMFRAIDKGGKIIVTGVGKSGKIGEKLVATMLSTGTSAAFLHPVEALHGDLGLVGPLDVVLALSYSGNTEELLLLIPSLKHRHVPVIGMGGNLKSKLAKECAAWLDAHVEKEAGDDLPAPTTSTTLALALGDAVALTLAKLRSFSTDGFALNHPGGSLGRRLLLKTEDAMIPHNKVACVSATAPLDIVIMEMTRHPKGCGVVVLEDSMTEEDLSSDLLSPPASLVASSDDASHEATNRVLGVITHGDIHRVLRAKVEIFEIKAADIMTHTPVTCAVHGLASEALKVMESSRKQPLPLLPVIDKEAGFRGVVTLKDLRELF